MTSGWIRLPAGHYSEPLKELSFWLGCRGGGVQTGRVSTRPRLDPERFQNTGIGTDNCLSSMQQISLDKTRPMPIWKLQERLNHGIAWQRNPSPSPEVNSGGLQQKTDLASLACAHSAADCSLWIAMARAALYGSSAPHCKVSY